MKSSLKTPPAFRKLRSLTRLARASRSEPHTVGIFFNSRGGRSYRSLSMAWPGSILFWIPSRPAISIAAKARYGLAVGSGKRTSTRFAFGEVVHGMRQEAERLRAE